MRIFLYASAFFLVALSGVVHGLWTGRWGHSADLQAAAARCDGVALNLGDWEGEPAPVNARQLAIAEVAGYLSRRYVNRLTGQTVSVLLLCGRPGPMSVHNPEICYQGAGFQLVGKQEQRRTEPDAAGGQAEFWTARFSRPGVPPEVIRIFWSWRDKGPWVAPANARLTFARSSHLYKLYVVRHLASPDELLEGDPCLDLLQVLLPELQRCLSPAS